MTGKVNSNNFLTLNPKSCSHYDCSFFMKYSKTNYYNYLVKRLFLDWEDIVTKARISIILCTSLYLQIIIRCSISMDAIISP
mgnify:CR=1 FL=1